MSFNQSVRYNTFGDENNPFSLYDYVKPPRWVFNTSDPIDTTGEDQWFFTNITTGDHFIKTNGTWTLYYNFSTGAPVPGITAIANDGFGVQLFKNIIGTTAHFRTLQSTNGKITFATLPDTIDLAVNLTASDVGLGDVQDTKSNFLAVVDPTPFNDNSPSQGYRVGSFWMNIATTPARFFICRNSTPAAAVWELINPNLKNVTDVGGGAGILRDIVSTTGLVRLKTLVSSTGKITFTAGSDTVDAGVSLVKGDVGLSLLDNTRYVTNSTVNPSVSNDNTTGYVVGNLWSNSTTGQLYMAQSVATGAAVWTLIAPSSSLRTDNDFTSRRMQSVNVTTSFSALSVPVFLEVGLINYGIDSQRGTWSSGNGGFGIVQNYGPPTNGQANNRYMITYTITARRNGASGVTNDYTIRLNTGTGGLPGNGVITGSSVTLFFPPTSEAFVSVVATKSTVYEFPSNGTVTFFFSAVANTSTNPIVTNQLNFIINQI